MNGLLLTPETSQHMSIGAHLFLDGPRIANLGIAHTLPATTDLSALKRHRVLVIVDEDNLRISMQNRGRKLSYRRLLDRVQSVADEVLPLAVLTAPPNDTQREQLLPKPGLEHADSAAGDSADMERYPHNGQRRHGHLL